MNLKSLALGLVASTSFFSNSTHANELQVEIEHERKIPYSHVKSVPDPYGEPKIQLRRVTWKNEIKNPTALDPKYDPIPVTNNLQIYPFRLNVPTEGVSSLKSRQFEFFTRHSYVDGKYQDSDSTFQTNIDQWLSEQTIGLKLGLPRHWQLMIQIPLYHFKGNSSYTQNGVELMGLGNNTRNFWGGPTLNLKHPFAYFPDEDLYLSYSFWFQFPETNSRANGGTSSAHWAFNTIAMKKWGEKTLHFNLGYENAGDLKMFNNQVLTQGFGVFSSLVYSEPLCNGYAWESQLHLSQNISDGIDKINDFNAYAALGIKKRLKKSSAMISAITGIDNMPNFGLTAEFS